MPSLAHGESIRSGHKTEDAPFAMPASPASTTIFSLTLSNEMGSSASSRPTLKRLPHKHEAVNLDTRPFGPINQARAAITQRPPSVFEQVPEGGRRPSMRSLMRGVASTSLCRRPKIGTRSSRDVEEEGFHCGESCGHDRGFEQEWMGGCRTPRVSYSAEVAPHGGDLVDTVIYERIPPSDCQLSHLR